MEVTEDMLGHYGNIDRNLGKCESLLCISFIVRLLRMSFLFVITGANKGGTRMGEIDMCGDPRKIKIISLCFKYQYLPLVWHK